MGGGGSSDLTGVRKGVIIGIDERALLFIAGNGVKCTVYR